LIIEIELSIHLPDYAVEPMNVFTESSLVKN